MFFFPSENKIFIKTWQGTDSVSQIIKVLKQKKKKRKIITPDASGLVAAVPSQLVTTAEISNFDQAPMLEKSPKSPKNTGFNSVTLV